MKPLFTLLFLLLASSATYVQGQTKSKDEAIADSLYESKNYIGAIGNFTKAINANQKNTKLLVSLLDKRALAEIDSKFYKDAVKDELAALAINPKYGDSYWNLGTAYKGAGDYQLAVDNYTKAIPYNTDDKANLATLYNNRGNAFRKMKKYKEAINDHTQAIALNSKNTDSHWDRALSYDKNGDYQLAIDDYTTAMFYNQEDVGDLATLYRDRANMKIKLKQYKEAINDFNTSMKLNPQDGDTYWDRARAYSRNGDYQLSANDYTAAMPFFKNDKINLAILYNNRADNEISMHQSDKAIADITTAIALNPQRGYLYRTRAVFHTENGECKAAIDDFTKAMEFYKDDKKALSSLHYDIASNYYILNENQKTLDECTTSIDLEPDYGAPYFLRGKIYLKRLVNKDLAIKDFNKAIELDTAKKSVGYIFSQLYTGHTALALQLLQQQVLSTPNPDDVLTHYYNIACVFSIMNKPEEANIYLKKAIDSGYSKKFAANDEDFDNIRKTPDYVALMTDSPSK
jgi:tetratricopeptide (TPR) repeat protein